VRACASLTDYSKIKIRLRFDANYPAPNIPASCLLDAFNNQGLLESAAPVVMLKSLESVQPLKLPG
jgi:hypothetical protein